MATDETNPDALKSYMEASAGVLGLAIRPEWAAGVRMNLSIALRLAKVVEEFALPDDIEPAPVFEA